MVSWATLREVGLFIIAVYGAVLSSVNFWRGTRKDKRAIKVTTNSLIPEYGLRAGPPILQINATNSGHRNVVVTMIALRLPDGKRMFPMDEMLPIGINNSVLPAQLAEGQSAKRHFMYFGIGGALLDSGFLQAVDLVPVAEDSIGGKYQGKAIKVDPKGWATMRPPG